MTPAPMHASGESRPAAYTAAARHRVPIHTCCNSCCSSCTQAQGEGEHRAHDD